MQGDNLSTVKVTECHAQSAAFWEGAIADAEQLLSEAKEARARESLRLAIDWFSKRLEWSTAEGENASDIAA